MVAGNLTFLLIIEDPVNEFFDIFDLNNEDCLLSIVVKLFTSLFTFSITDEICDLFFSCFNEIFELDSSLISQILFKSVDNTNIIIYLSYIFLK